MSRCYNCKHMQTVPGNAHISCKKPDHGMTGNSHGIVSGWFYYPVLFDPVWMTKVCSNFEDKDDSKENT